jgi:chromosome partitioning protein
MGVLMPTIVFCSPKGGSGKTTSALLLAIQLADFYDVTVIDADPNRPIKDWAAGGNAPARLTVVSDVDENNIVERIEEAAATTSMVIVDLEGTAAKIVLMALSQADFAVVPTQGSQLDAKESSRAIKVIKQTQKMTGRELPYAVLLTRISPGPIRTRTLSHIQRGLIDAGVPVLETELNEREAFRAVFSFRQPLTGLNPADVSNIDKAQANVGMLAIEILRKLIPETNKTSEQGAKVA